MIHKSFSTFTLNTLTHQKTVHSCFTDNLSSQKFWMKAGLDCSPLPSTLMSCCSNVWMWFYCPAGISWDVPEKDVFWMAAHAIPKPEYTTDINEDGHTSPLPPTLQKCSPVQAPPPCTGDIIWSQIVSHPLMRRVSCLHDVPPPLYRIE